MTYEDCNCVSESRRREMYYFQCTTWSLVFSCSDKASRADSMPFSEAYFLLASAAVLDY